MSDGPMIARKIEPSEPHGDGGVSAFCDDCPDHEACASGYPCATNSESESAPQWTVQEDKHGAAHGVRVEEGWVRADGGTIQRCAACTPVYSMVETELLDETGLDAEQDARVTALYHSKAMLSKSGMVSGGGVPSADLIRVAKWIIEGS